MIVDLPEPGAIRCIGGSLLVACAAVGLEADALPSSDTGGGVVPAQKHALLPTGIVGGLVWAEHKRVGGLHLCAEIPLELGLGHGYPFRRSTSVVVVRRRTTVPASPSTRTRSPERSRRDPS